MGDDPFLCHVLRQVSLYCVASPAELRDLRLVCRAASHAACGRPAAARDFCMRLLARWDASISWAWRPPLFRLDREGRIVEVGLHFDARKPGRALRDVAARLQFAKMLHAERPTGRTKRDACDRMLAAFRGIGDCTCWWKRAKVLARHDAELRRCRPRWFLTAPSR